MALVAVVLAGLIAGFVLGLILDRAYQDGHAGRRGRPPRRRLTLLAAAGACVAGIVWSSTSGPAEAVATAVVTSIFLALAATDVERRLLPNRIMYPAIPLALLLGPWLPAGGYLSAVFGAALGFAVLLVPHLVVRGALGAGDVKLGALIGAFAGAWLLLPALTIGAVIGAVSSLILLVRSRSRRSTLAYGPYLIIGALLTPLI